MMRKRNAMIGLSLLTVLLLVALNGCSGSTQDEAESPVPESAPSESMVSGSEVSGETTRGADFNGNRTPAYAFFGDRTYEQRQYDASLLRDEHVTNIEAGSYTVMVYLDGSTNLEDPNYDYAGSTFGSMTIDAILSSGVNPDIVNVVIMTGGSDSWGHAGLEGNGNYILHVVKDGSGQGLSTSVDYHSTEPLSMGSPDTLRSFVDFAETNYPADHYALVIWNHGNGPLYGCAEDENHDGDSLLLSELSEALDATDFGTSKMFDWIGFDCGLMGDLEVADTLAKYSYYMIASQDLETGVGSSFDYGTAWVYGFLDALNSTSSPIAITTEAIDRYADGKELASSDRNTRTLYTMSLIDLTRVGGVEEALDGLFYRMVDSLEAGEYASLARLREFTKEFYEGGSLDLVDLGYMAWTLEELYPEEARNVENAIDELVLYQRTNVPEASGISLYYPYRNVELYDEGGGRDICSQFDFSTGYLAYLEGFTNALINGEGDADRENGESDSGSEVDEPHFAASAANDEYTIHLSEDQQKESVRISYNVLRRGNDDDSWSGGSGYYRIMLQDCQVAPDADGVVHIARNQTLLTLQGEDGKPVVWPFKQVASGAQTASYQSLMTTIEGPFGAMAWTDSTPIMIIATETLGEGLPIISSINYLGENSGIEGKSDVDINRYDYLANWVQPCSPNGNASEPVWNWTSWDGIAGHQIPIDSFLSIGTTTTSELEGDYVLQVVITDLYGESYASELYELDCLGVPDEEIADVDGVSCTFVIYDDHVVLADAEGSATEFSIPSEYQDKPVTVIGQGAFSGTPINSVVVPESVASIDDGAFAGCPLERISLPEGLLSVSRRAFAGCENLVEVILPHSLEMIGDSAFAGCEQLSMLEIPANVTYIGDGAFQQCSRLRHLTVADGNESFKIENNDDGNVLYTADGTELVSCPSLFHSEYSVAEGTVRIRDRAFYGSYTEKFSGKSDGSEGHNIVGYGLVRIVFPSTLREIGDAAFFECNRLESIDLPEGLEIIGAEAFGSTDLTGTTGFGSVKFEKDIIERVEIGGNVRWIGQAAFNSFTVEEFVVDEGNQHYSAANGRLVSRDGKKEIDVYGE